MEVVTICIEGGNMDELIVLMYKQGVSINGIVDKVFKINKRNVPQNYSFANFPLYKDREYTRLNCITYVSKVILNYNRLNRK